MEPKNNLRLFSSDKHGFSIKYNIDPKVESVSLLLRTNRVNHNRESELGPQSVTILVPKPLFFTIFYDGLLRVIDCNVICNFTYDYIKDIEKEKEMEPCTSFLNIVEFSRNRSFLHKLFAYFEVEDEKKYLLISPHIAIGMPMQNQISLEVYYDYGLLNNPKSNYKTHYVPYSCLPEILFFTTEEAAKILEFVSVCRYAEQKSYKDILN